MTDHISAGHLSPAAVWRHNVTPCTHTQTCTSTLQHTRTHPFPPTYPEAGASITYGLARGLHSHTGTHTAAHIHSFTHTNAHKHVHKYTPICYASNIHAFIGTHITHTHTQKVVRLKENNWNKKAHNMAVCPQAWGLTPTSGPHVFLVPHCSASVFSDSQNEEIRGDLIGNIVVSVKGKVKWRDDEREIVKQMEGETRNRKKTLTTKGKKKKKVKR